MPSDNTNRADETLLKNTNEDHIPVPSDKAPMYEIVVHFGKHTIFNYSPWADR